MNTALIISNGEVEVAVFRSKPVETQRTSLKLVERNYRRSLIAALGNWAGTVAGRRRTVTNLICDELSSKKIRWE